MAFLAGCLEVGLAAPKEGASGPTAWANLVPRSSLAPWRTVLLSGRLFSSAVSPSFDEAPLL